MAPVTVLTPIHPHPAPGETECANAIFQQPWWLDAVAPGRWGEATCERNGRVVARLPYAVRGRRRLGMLTQSSLTQTLGPWVEHSSARPARALAREHELLGELEAGLPRASAFSQQFSPAVLNALPFHWAGLPPRGFAHVPAGGPRLTGRSVGRSARQRSARDPQARTRVEIVDDLGLDRFHDVLSKTYTRQRIPTPHSLAELERLEAACARRGAGATLFARDDAGQVHAVAWVVWDRRAAYYLLAGAEPHLRNSGASSLLMWEAIMRARAVTDVFDFHGSMLQPVERFFRAFGARQTPYLSVTRMSPALRLALTARSGLHRLAARP